jgi:hypothetical protein
MFCTSARIGPLHQSWLGKTWIGVGEGDVSRRLFTEFFKHSNFFSTFFQLTSALCGPARRFSFFIVAVLVMVQDGNRSAWQYANELRFFLDWKK